MTAKKALKKAKSAIKSGGRRTSASGASKKDDVIEIILKDHKPLKQLLKTLKNSDHSLSKRQEAFEEFSTLLLVHAKAEEDAVYARIKDEGDLREEGFEGQVEHSLAEQTLETAQATDDEDLWSARVKVLAELVEHHIEEEESDLFPDLRKHLQAEERADMGRRYLEFKSQYESTSFQEEDEESDERRSDKSTRGEGMRFQMSDAADSVDALEVTFGTGTLQAERAETKQNT